MPINLVPSILENSEFGKEQLHKVSLIITIRHFPLQFAERPSVQQPPVYQSCMISYELFSEKIMFYIFGSTL